MKTIRPEHMGPRILHQFDETPSSRVRLLFVVGHLGHGGSEQMLYDILSHMDRSIFEPSVCCTRAAGDPEWHERFHAAGINTVVVPYCPDGWYRVWAMYRHLMRERFQIVHIYNYEGNTVWSRIAAILARVPVVMTYDLDVRLWEKSWRNYLEWWALNRFTARNVCISVAGAGWRKQYCGGHPEKVVTILDGIDLDQFRPCSPEEKARAKASIGVVPNHKVVGAVGRLVEWKRFDLFLTAASLLKDHDCEFVLRGEGPLEPYLKSLAEELGIAGRTHFVGWVPDVRSVTRAFDVQVVTSNEQEGFGLTTVEAMACGIPVVVVNNATHGEIVGDAGFVVHPEPAEIADAVDRIIADPKLACALREKGRKRAEDRFAIHRAVSELSGLYLDALK